MGDIPRSKHGILPHQTGLGQQKTLYHCTPMGKYEYNALPMGLCSSCDIFQEKMSELMQGLEFCENIH